MYDEVKQLVELEITKVVIGSIMGDGAIPVGGRELRKEPCTGCRIDKSKPFEPGNAIVTTKGAIGTLSKEEAREWCSELIEVTDGRCSRSRGIREAAEKCRSQHPGDTDGFFKCYAPSWAGMSSGSGPSKLTPSSVEGKRLLQKGLFPERDKALLKLASETKSTNAPYGVAIVEVHDDGDLTVESGDNKLYVVTTEGQIFEQR